MIKENQQRVTEIKEEVSNMRESINRCKRHDTITLLERVKKGMSDLFVEWRLNSCGYILEATGPFFINIQE